MTEENIQEKIMGKLLEIIELADLLEATGYPKVSESIKSQMYRILYGSNFDSEFIQIGSKHDAPNKD